MRKPFKECSHEEQRLYYPNVCKLCDFINATENPRATLELLDVCLSGKAVIYGKDGGRCQEKI